MAREVHDQTTAITLARRTGAKYVRGVWAALAFAMGFACIRAADTPGEPVIDPATPAWRELAEAFSREPDVIANFEERRVFPFRKTPVVLRGEVRVSQTRGLSLRYFGDPERIVILDETGVLVRGADAEPLPPDRRAEAGQRAMLHVLRLDFAALRDDFELRGQIDGVAWRLVLVPRTEALRRTLGTMRVWGEGPAVAAIELRRSEKQHVTIAISDRRQAGTFSSEELRRYFR